MFSLTNYEDVHDSNNNFCFYVPWCGDCVGDTIEENPEHLKRCCKVTLAQTVNASCIPFRLTELFAKACCGNLFHSHELSENYCRKTQTSLWWTKIADKSVELDKEQEA